MREFIVTEEDIMLLSAKECPSTKAQFTRMWQLNNGEGMTEIVRCRDCVYREHHEENMTYSRTTEGVTEWCRRFADYEGSLEPLNDLDGFCCWGVRREDA